MKKNVIIALTLLGVLACSPKTEEVKVMARAVPERADDFVFENDVIAGRFYGQALEGNPTSPGIDIWVKLPGKLVADEWYEHAVNEDPDYYHHNHGGKDCYKVAVSLGGGASAPIIGGDLRYPATNYRSFEVLEQTPARVRFALEYPAWEAVEGVPVSLRKEVTLEAGSYFAEVADYYSFPDSLGTLTVAAGIKLHGAQGTVETTHEGEGCIAIWEHASDQSIEPEDGMLGVAVVALQDNCGVCCNPDLDHALVTGTVRPGEPFRYRFGSCWSKGEVQTADAWFAKVDEQCAKKDNQQ